MEKTRKFLMSPLGIYFVLLITGLSIAFFETIPIIQEGNKIALSDIGHVGSHVFIAGWGMFLSLKWTNLGRFKIESFRYVSLAIIAICSVIGVIISWTIGAHDHGADYSWMFLIIGAIGILQHIILSNYHEHSKATGHHDILCSGLRYHVAADIVKSFLFASLFFVPGGNYEIYVHVGASISIIVGAGFMLRSVVKH